MADLTGHTLGRYHLIERLGEGGMATVYKAYDTRLETDVAVKVIRMDRLTEENKERALKRFEREAKALAKLTHANIISVKDYGEYEGKPYLVMPYLPGGTLKEKLGKPMPWQEALRILLPIVRALDFAHDQNMIHRDVKPSNIMMTLAGDPMLTDFGIAKILDLEETADLTGTGMGIGTPEYMAPEQWTGKTSTQSDQYALGVVLYEMLTGRMPYSADTPAAILLKQANDPLARPSQYTHDLPEKVEKLLIKALAKNPADRYASMGDLAGAMESLLAGTAVPVKEQPAQRSGRAANTLTTVEEGLEEPTVMDSVVPQARATQTFAPAPASQKSRNTVLIIGLGLLFGVLCMSVLAGGGYFIYKQFASPTQAAMPSATGQPPASTLITTPLATPTSMPITTPTLTMPSGPVEEIFKVTSILKVYNTASAPTTFTIDLTWQVTEIMTYHWNNGQGTSSPGTIGLQAADGTMYGPWQAAGQNGQGGVPNAVWVVNPNMIIPPGTYTVIDSDPYTWSQNAETGGAGITWCYGIHQAIP